MLSKWRKHKAASPEPDGCDPSVFGEQISTYLQEAAAERALLEEDAALGRAQTNAAPPTHSLDLEFQSDAPAAVAEIEPHAAIDIHAVAGFEADVSLEAVSSVEAIADIERIASIEATAHIEAVADIEIELETQVAPAAPMPEADVAELVAAEPFAVDPLEGTSTPLPDDARMELVDRIEAAFDEIDRDPHVDQPVAVSAISIKGGAPAFDPFDLLPQTLEPPEIAEEVVAALDLIAAAPKSVPAARPVKPRFAAFVAAPPRTAAQPLLAEPPAGPRSDIAPWVPMYLTPGRIWPALEGVPAETPAARTEQPDWIELVASLRQDLERRRIDRPAAADPIAVRPSDGANAETQRLVKKPRMHARKAKPVQDEWGFFDPEQCGFSTLLAKLEEITEEEVRS